MPSKNKGFCGFLQESEKWQTMYYELLSQVPLEQVGISWMCLYPHTITIFVIYLAGGGVFALYFMQLVLLDSNQIWREGRRSVSFGGLELSKVQKHL